MMKIKIPTRLHITLISMHENSYRQNGGIGFAIDTPSLEIEFKENKLLEIYDQREKGFTSLEQKRITEILNTLGKKKSFTKRFTATIKGDVPTHMGFGSTTAVRLALVEGLYIINKCDYTKEEIVYASERGGVSGIGIETYFNGGFVLDIGRADKSRFAPSSTMEKENKSLPLICKSIKMPNWKIGICIPDIISKTEAEEKEFFNKTCPIGEKESHKVLYHGVYGLLASVEEDDKETFQEAIKQIQKCEWKNAERLLYGDTLLQKENILYTCGAKAVGMSSLGASLYFLAEDIELVINKAKSILPNSQFFIADINNTGRMIDYD